eukprot:6204722-Pleurochrysis_carterae.AAC.2
MENVQMFDKESRKSANPKPSLCQFVRFERRMYLCVRLCLYWAPTVYPWVWVCECRRVQLTSMWQVHASARPARLGVGMRGWPSMCARVCAPVR